MTLSYISPFDKLRAIEQTQSDVGHLVDLNRMQLLASIINLQHRQENDRTLSSALGDIAFSMDRILDSTRDTATSLRHIEKGIVDLRVVVEQWLGYLSTQLEEQERTLQQISDTLRNPAQTKVDEKVRKAESLMKSATEPDCYEDYRQTYLHSSLELLEEVVRNDMGKLDYLAWFNLGGLRWKVINDLSAAEQAFAQAAALSFPHRNAYYYTSLMEQANVRYLFGNSLGAYEIVQRAMKEQQDPETFFQAARYASASGDHEQAIHFLESSIRSATCYVLRVAEDDFSPIAPQVSTLVDKLTNEAQKAARSAQLRLQHVIDVVHRADEAIPEVSNEVLARETRVIDLLAADTSSMDYVTALEVKPEIENHVQSIVFKMKDAIKSRVVQTTQIISKAVHDTERVDAELISVDKQHNEVCLSVTQKLSKKPYRLRSTAIIAVTVVLTWVFIYNVRLGEYGGVAQYMDGYNSPFLVAKRQGAALIAYLGAAFIGGLLLYVLRDHFRLPKTYSADKRKLKGEMQQSVKSHKAKRGLLVEQKEIALITLSTATATRSMLENILTALESETRAVPGP